MDWTAVEEQYPFILIADGDWGVTTSVAPPEGFVADFPVISADAAASLAEVAPPEGFVADFPALSTTVSDAVTALQFTLKDVGSDWTATGITHVITHKGETRIRTSKVPMFNKQRSPAGNDEKEKKEVPGNALRKPVTLPVLPSRVIAGLMGTLLERPVRFARPAGAGHESVPAGWAPFSSVPFHVSCHEPHLTTRADRSRTAADLRHTARDFSPGAGEEFFFARD